MRMPGTRTDYLAGGPGKFMCGIELRDKITRERILARASCLPESSGRALVADAREDSPVSDAPHPQKRDGQRVRRVSPTYDMQRHTQVMRGTSLAGRFVRSWRSFRSSRGAILQMARHW